VDDQLIELARRKSGVSTVEAHDKLGYCVKAARRHLLALVDSGVLVSAKVGPRSSWLRFFGSAADACAYELIQPKRRGFTITSPRGPKRAAVGEVDYSRAKITRAPASTIDPRYQIDPATFSGGEFMAEWKRLRRQA